MTVNQILAMLAMSWPEKAKISIVINVLPGGVMDYSVALILDLHENSFVNRNSPEPDLGRALADVYDQYQSYELMKIVAFD